MNTLNTSYINEYFNACVSEASDKLLSVPLLQKLHIISQQELHCFFSQLYYFVDFFPGLLGILITKTTNKRIRFAITENLVDESGGMQNILSNDYSGVHSELLYRFIHSIDESKCSLAKISPSTNNLMKALQDFFLNASLIETFGAMASMECMSTSWFTLIHKQLVSLGRFNENDLNFFALHMSLDDDHGNVFKEELISLIERDSDLQLLAKGIKTSIQCWLNFYAGLESEFLGKDNAN